MRSFVMLALVLLIAGSVAGQTIWTPLVDGTGLSLEILFPSFDESDEITFFTSVSTLSGLIEMSDHLSLIIEVPISHYGEEGEESATEIGNIFFGLTGYRPDVKVFADAGIRIPTIGDNAKFGPLVSGLFTDFIERPSAFGRDHITLNGAVNYRTVNASGLLFRGRFGGDFSFSTGENSDGADLLLALGMQAGYHGESFELLGGVSTRYFLTVEGDFEELLFGEFGVLASAALGNVHPGLSLQVPLDDDLQEVVNFVVGVSVMVILHPGPAGGSGSE